MVVKPKAKTGAERRRSPRLERRIPVKVRAQDPQGKAHEETAEADEVSYHGARIETQTEFHAGTVLTLESPMTLESARYRVVWARHKQDSGKWLLGLELASGEPTLWGIDLTGGADKHP